MAPRERSSSVEIVSYTDSRKMIKLTSQRPTRQLPEVLVMENSSSDDGILDDEVDPNDVVPYWSADKSTTSSQSYTAAPRSSTPRDVIVKPKREADMGTANLTRNEKVKSEPDTEPLKADKKPDTKKIKGKSAKPEPSYSTINIKEEPVRIGVTIKAEHVEDDQLKFISLVKRENGKGIDMFNLDNLDLGPNIKVEERAHTGWTRKVISDAFGGNHQICHHNWYDPATLAKKHKNKDLTHIKPYLVFSRKWNPQLPLKPGQHGVVFCGVQYFDDKTKVDQDVAFFASDGPKDWKLLGHYCVKQYGEVSAEDMHRMPASMIRSWVKGAHTSVWGREWVEGTNAILPEADKIDFSEDGIRAAFFDGRMVCTFTIMQCVGFHTEMLDRLEYYRKHPKPSKEELKAQRAVEKAKKAPKEKKIKRSASAAKSESESDDSKIVVKAEIKRDLKDSKGSGLRGKRHRVKEESGPESDSEGRLRKIAKGRRGRRVVAVSESESEYEDN